MDPSGFEPEASCVLGLTCKAGALPLSYGPRYIYVL